MLLTPVQINRLDKAQEEGRRVQIRMSARQVAKNASYTGLSLDMLASLAASDLSTILSGLTTGLLCGGINKGNGLYLAPHPRFVEGDGLFQKHGNDIMVLVC